MLLFFFLVKDYVIEKKPSNLRIVEGRSSAPYPEVLPSAVLSTLHPSSTILFGSSEDKTADGVHALAEIDFCVVANLTYRL
jgi:hypothetical protein